MSDYRQGQDEQGINPYNPLEEDGWKIIEGTPEQSVRIDHGTFEEGPLVAIWQCTKGVIEMEAMPFNEFITVYEGGAIARLDGGAPIELKPGDSFYIEKGQRIRWEIKNIVKKYMLVAATGPVVS